MILNSCGPIIHMVFHPPKKLKSFKNYLVVNFLCILCLFDLDLDFSLTKLYFIHSVRILDLHIFYLNFKLICVTLQFHRILFVKKFVLVVILLLTPGDLFKSAYISKNQHLLIQDLLVMLSSLHHLGTLLRNLLFQ